MRVQCPQCHAGLQLAQAPPAGAKIQCPKCGTQFRVQAPAPVTVTPVDLPGPAVTDTRVTDSTVTQQPAATLPANRLAAPVAVTPVAVTPVAVTPVIVTEDSGDPEDIDEQLPRKKKKKKGSKSRGSNQAVTFGLALGIFVLLAGGVIFALVYSGVFSGKSIVDFNNEMVNILVRMELSSEEFFQAQAGMQNPTRALQQFGNARGYVHHALLEVRAISPPSEGQRFYDATAQYLERLERFLSTDLEQLGELVSKNRQNEARQMLTLGLSEIRNLQNAYLHAQHELAKKYSFAQMEAPGKQRRGPRSGS